MEGTRRRFPKENYYLNWTAGKKEGNQGRGSRTTSIACATEEETRFFCREETREATKGRVSHRTATVRRAVQGSKTREKKWEEQPL